jgi:hypothetical protein
VHGGMRQSPLASGAKCRSLEHPPRSRSTAHAATRARQELMPALPSPRSGGER